MGLRRTLKTINRQVHKDLNDVCAVHAHSHVFSEGPNIQLMVQAAGMNPSQMADIGEDLVNSYPGSFIGMTAQKAQVTA